jgi:NTE family protein
MSRIATAKKARTAGASGTARRPSVALALGGGGARGLAHILVLEAFEELGIRPVMIAGTSIGAIFGAAFASGLSARHIRAHTEETLGQRFDLVRHLFSARAEPVLKLFNLLPLRAAILDPLALLDLLLPVRVAKTFEELQIPLAVVATDFLAQEAAILDKGPLRPAVAASMALPALFQPVSIDGRLLVDGGLVDPLPFALIAGKADITVAIDVGGAPRLPEDGKPPSGLEILFSSSLIMQAALVREKLKTEQPDIYVDVDVDRFHVLEFYRHGDILAAAAPAKERLKAQLTRLLESVTLEPVPNSGNAPVLPAPAAAHGAVEMRKPGRPGTLGALGSKLRRPRRKD